MIILFIICFILICCILYNIMFPLPPPKPKWRIDTYRQDIDGPYYVEGKYWNIQTVGYMIPCTVSFTDKDKIEEMADTFCSFFTYAVVYNSFEPEGKIVYDTEHCARWCKSRKPAMINF